MRKMMIVFCLSPLLVFSQKKEKPKPAWIVSSGIIAGANETKPLFQAAGGITYSRYFTGIGIGYDSYRFNTIPVFADWRVSVGNRKVIFGYAQAGYNFPGHYQKENEYRKVSDRLEGGFYMDAGIGYRLPLGQGHRLLFSAGYSRKYIAQEKGYTYPCGIVPCTGAEPVVYTYRYSFNRILVKAGWEWGK